MKTLIKKHEVVRVEKWEVDGETFYYTEADCCDQFNLLYDLNCAQICAPTGGFSGQGDGLCPQFNGTVVKTEIWSQD
ncbi:MAG: hypothetical protein H6581_04215 [Bacteroidia bacterium]|nr:hypothetical protein [Bacteroidia bacterium]